MSMQVTRSDWTLTSEVTYLNHGSFGPSPKLVQTAREAWSRRLESQPMDFYIGQMEPALDAAATQLGRFINADPRDLVFVDNATVAMNAVAASIELNAGDEVLLTDHEYGAVVRIWRQRCEQVGARLVFARIGSSANLPTSDSVSTDSRRIFQSIDDVIEPLFQAVTPQTKLIVVSHITSATAIKLPVEQICHRARLLGISVCVDGPHAIAMQTVNLKQLGCDFYCASLHKWLSAPFGSGFLYVDRRFQKAIRSHLVSWGRSLGGFSPRWQDQFNWVGTRDPAPFLAVPDAIQFLESVGLDRFRQQTHALAEYARSQLHQYFGEPAWIPDAIEWYGSMTAVPLPVQSARKAKPNAMHPLQRELRERYRIEIPITECCGYRFMRVSCHLYNTKSEIDQLVSAIREIEASGTAVK